MTLKYAVMSNVRYEKCAMTSKVNHSERRSAICDCRVCTGQSSDLERAHVQWQCAAVTPQVNLSFSKHLIEFFAIELIVSIVVSAIAVFRLFDNILSHNLPC